MSTLPKDSQAVHEAAVKGDFEQVKHLIVAGAELNVLDDSGQTLLDSIVFYFVGEDAPSFRIEMLRLLFQLGIDPNLTGGEGSSAMTAAMFAMDIEVIRTLLEAGADPNLLAGFDPSESFYDLAVFDYRYRVWLRDNPEVDSINPPEAPTDDDMQSEESWLDYLDRVAVKYGVRRPDHLFLLRKYGAKTAQELALSS